MLRFPSPHSGILFLCLMFPNIKGNLIKVVSVPSFGDSFFIPYAMEMKLKDVEVVSVPSFGDSFFMPPLLCSMAMVAIVSVPSFGDSFFIWGRQTHAKSCNEFPSPHSGILFLCANSTAKGFQSGESFRPLIRGFFFYHKS